jgi:hypothetical protein
MPPAARPRPANLLTQEVGEFIATGLPQRKIPHRSSLSISDEERERRRKAALERVANGQMGGAKFGRMGGRGNTRKRRRAQAALAEEAAKPENRKKMLAVFHDALDPSQPISVRLKAVDQWVGLEQAESKMTLEEEKVDAVQRSREDSIELLRNKLMGNGVAAAVLRAQAQLEEVTIPDADVVED